MSKYVSDTKAGKSISAWVILKGKRQVATVRAHFSDSGSVLVNVFQDAQGAERSEAAAARDGVKLKPNEWGEKSLGFQHATAGGYGYDKLTAALSGLYIDGHVMTDHCSRKGAPKRPPNGLQRWPYESKPPRGYEFANYQQRFITFGFSSEKHEREDFTGNDGYESCYRLPGLKYLEAKGYTVIQAI